MMLTIRTAAPRLYQAFRTRIFSGSAAVFQAVESNSNEAVAMSELTYDDVQRLMKSTSPPRLIDVREPAELVEFGQYEGAVNLPLGQLKEALQSTDDVQFERLYGFAKPNKLNSTVVFACHSGRRSAQATQIASELGYTMAKNYKGGWLDYHERAGLPLKRTAQTDAASPSKK